jgi:hypothetical protein
VRQFGRLPKAILAHASPVLCHSARIVLGSGLSFLKQRIAGYVFAWLALTVAFVLRMAGGAALMIGVLVNAARDPQ